MSETVQELDTIIVGGGISGLACARQLHDKGMPFTLVTDHLGGRLALSKQGHYIGAVMMNNDYVHIKQHAGKAFTSRPWHSYIWDGSKGVNSLMRMNFLKIPRLNKVFGEFGHAFQRLRAQAPYTCQKQLMEQDPLLRKLVSQSAVEFVREQKIEAIAEQFLGAIAGAVFLCDWNEMSAFHFCVGISCTGNGACNGDWSNTIASLTAGYTDKIITDEIVSIVKADDGGGFTVSSSSRQYRAKNVVLSVPGASGDALLEKYCSTECPLVDNAERVPCHVFHITGSRKPLYRPKRSLLMGAGEEIKLFFPLPDGVDVVYTSTREPDFSRYYDDYQIIERRHWQPAIQLSRQEWRPLQLEPGLFTIGDYNICGLEDSYLTGLFAANTIIEQSKPI